MNLIIAFLSPMIYGLSTTLDSHLSNNIFSRTRSLVFFGGMLNVVFLPLFFLIMRPNLFTLHVLPFILLIALIDVAYLFPYYKAVKKIDTSIVNALFSLGRIFVPILAFFIVKERLSPIQYFGFFIITISSVLLAFEPKKLKLNSSFFLMGSVSILLSIEAVLYKFILESISWETALFWTASFSFLFSSSLFLSRHNREIIKNDFGNFKKSIRVSASQEVITWGGNMMSIYVISALPVTVVKGIGASQPIFVLIYALIFTKLLPKVFKEKTDMRNIAKKMILFLGIILGTLLVV